MSTNNFAWTLVDDANVMMAYGDKDNQVHLCERTIEDCISQCEKVIVRFAKSEKHSFPIAIQNIGAYVFVLRSLIQYQGNKPKIILTDER